MVIDASAVLAILRDEPEAGTFARAIKETGQRLMSPVNWFEVAMNSEKLGRADFAAFEKFCDYVGLRVVPLDEEQAKIAHRAWRKFGKGRHAAKLNMGACFAYALAKQAGEPLLYKGGDFSETDIASAV